MEDSDVVTFTYTIDRMSKLEHKSRLMYDMDSMKVWSVIDYDSDKMYLIKGLQGCTADRRRHGIGEAQITCMNTVSSWQVRITLMFTFRMVIRIIPHNWAISVQASRKGLHQRKGYPDGAGNYVNDKTVTADDFTCISEGYQFDLGGVVLDNYDIPGHTPGCMMLRDKGAQHSLFVRSAGL